MNDIVLGITLRGNSSDFRGELKGSRDELDRLKGAAVSAGTGARKLGRDTEAAGRELRRTEGVTSSLKRELIGLAAAYGSIQALSSLAGGIVRTNVEFERLAGALETVTGSAEAGREAFAMIERFAATTPFQLEEVVSAFIKLQARGLDPSAQALLSYGNTASAMGKSLDQMIESVADASTGEFERLKEFGIKASVEGDKVSLTFRGVTTEVRKTAKDIETALLRIGAVEFAGAMERQMDRLPGVFSNIEDSVSALQRAVGQGGLNDALRESGKELSAWLNGQQAAAAGLGEVAGAAIRNIGPVAELAAVYGSTRIAAALMTRAIAGNAGMVVALRLMAAVSPMAAVRLAAIGTAAGAASVGVGLLRGAMALLGGPVGVAALAAGAIFAFGRRADTAADATQTLNDKVAEQIRLLRESRGEIDDETSSIEKNTRALITQISARAAKLRADQQEQEAAAARFAARRETLPRGSIRLGSVALGADQAAAHARELDAQAAALEQKAAALRAELAKPPTAGTGSGLARTAGASALDTGLPDTNSHAAAGSFRAAQDEARNANFASVVGEGRFSAGEEAAKKHADAVKEVAKAYRDTLPPLDAAVAEAQAWRTDALKGLDETAAGYDAFARQVEAVYQDKIKEAYEQNLEDSTRWSDGAIRALRSYADEAGDVADGVERTFMRGFQGMEDAVVEFARTGKLSFADFANAIISDLLRIAVRSAITGPLASAIGSAFSGMFAGGGGPALQTGDFAGAYNSANAGFLHEGGIAGGPGMRTKRVPLSIFAGAQRYHGGGLALAPDEVPAILRRNEEVLTEDDPRHRNNAGGGRRGGDTYYIDATGADAAGLARLESTIRQLNGSIERRSVAAVVDARRRNPRLFGGAGVR